MDQESKIEPQKAGSGDKPQHEMSKRGHPGSENINDPKESVGGPDVPGKPPERTPDHPRDSAARI